MDWLTIASAAIAGALSAAIASLVIRNSKQRRVPFLLVMLLLFFTVKTVSEVTILPRIRLWETDRRLKSLPFYRDIAEADPATYAKIIAVVSASNRNESAEEILSKTTPIVAGTVSRYAGTASDESVVGFIHSTVSIVRDIQRSDPDSCYYYLFPTQGTANYKQTDIDEEKKNAMVAAMGEMVHSSVHSPQPLPDGTRAQQLLGPVIVKLRDEFGSDLALLQQKPTDAPGRGKVCAIAISLYENVDSMPSKDAGVVLRYLLSDQKDQRAGR